MAGWWRALPAAWMVLLAVPVAAAPRAVLNEADLRDRIYACWLGKSIGGTLGAPLEGRQEMHSLTFFDPVPTKQIPNDDLDLQLLWLKALEERGPGVDATTLGQYWLRYVPVDWNEYGIGKANMRRGLPPPLSGHFRNVWRDSNGAWIRSEVWACVAPGCPSLAAQYAWEDACVDHGAAEGTWAELFTASLESAAFVEHDRDTLLRIALSYVPPKSAVAAAVRAAMDAHTRGLDLAAAREAVVKATESTGWFMAPRNVAFTMLGWLYGDGDFGKSLCAAVNCGDDTDCTGATLGSLWGILYGTKGVPERWRAPVGETILNVAISGFQPPATIGELTDRTLAMARRVLAEKRAPVRVSAAPTSVPRGLPLVDTRAARALWARSPWQATWQAGALRVTADLGGEPVLTPGQPKAVSLTLQNTATRPLAATVALTGADGVSVTPRSSAVELAPRQRTRLEAQVTCSQELMALGAAEWTLTVTPRDGEPLTATLAHIVQIAAHPGDVALARAGGTATSDSELDREPGCTAKVIDGVIGGADGFEGKRWHSALTPHPHWVAVHLPSAQAIGRIVVHFADPAGHPVDFDCQASDDGAQWHTIATVTGWKDPARYGLKLDHPVTLRHFRLLIRRSASTQWPDAAQLSEVELLPP